MQNPQPAEFKKPSRLSIFWWRSYFSDDPSSVFNEKGVYYDREGDLKYPADRSPPITYWNNDTWFWFYTWDWGLTGGIGGFGGAGAGGSVDGCLLLMAVLLVFLALIMAIVVVFTWPPSMIIAWVILVVGSFAEAITGKDPSCVNFRTYNAVSAAIVLLYLLHVSLGVYQLQNLYNCYYPGTPGNKINVVRLLSFFKQTKIAYAVICLPAVTMMIAGIVVGSCTHAKVCASFSSCYWTSFTLYAWIAIHFLNAFASFSMYRRMEAKYQKLRKPPAYQLTGMNREPLPFLQPLPPYK